ncbi:MAG: ribonuclease III [Spirochaetaceae bacterium]|jgi:ribonuclease-3|nr:ribonuclease III [Spirochaetaceae bacterium]
MKILELPDIDGNRKRKLLSFQKTCKIKFKNIRLLNLAFVHRSVFNEIPRHEVKHNNERLEFLGDAILGAVTAALLYRRYPEQNEGALAKIKSIIVSAETLSSIARELEIDTLIVLGHGEELSGGRNKKTLLADAMEAIFGALYLDSGYDAAVSFIERCIKPEIERVRENKGFQDYKSVFQETCQRLFKNYPIYRLIKHSGPEHEHFFWVEACIDGRIFGPGMGRNKKSAEQEAAKLAMEILLKGS